jgi:AI-2 transport protein TqsA
MDNQSSKLVALLVGIASIFVVMFGIRETASIINPILLATVITIVVLPIPGSLTRRGVPGWLAMVLTILAVVLLLGLVIMTTIFSVTKLTTTLPQYMADAAVTAANELPTEVTGTELPVSTTNLTIQFGPLIQGALSSVLGVVAQFGIALFIFFFMISAAMALPGAVRLGLDPQAPVIGRITKLTEDVRHYLTILTGINFLVGAGNTVFLMILGVDFALLWGLLAWFMGYIPSIGFIIALIPPLILAYAQYGLQTAIWVLIGYVVINGGVQNFIQPRIMGQGLKINPVVVFVGLFIWGYLLGGIGALLAVPLTLLVLTVMENFESTRMVAILMRFTGGEKKEEDKEAIKQAQSLWEKAKATFTPPQEPQAKAKAKGKK